MEDGEVNAVQHPPFLCNESLNCQLINQATLKIQQWGNNYYIIIDK